MEKQGNLFCRAIGKGAPGAGNREDEGSWRRPPANRENAESWRKDDDARVERAQRERLAEERRHQAEREAREQAEREKLR
ncbi:unnamed protein product [Cladocopium goreaui]|uniref:Uncharacterized protein n=1 Tax=Cladocopium goreaui TaxID=2562237 RepID=A0A9P1BYY5_9DINO|nr:unnamed protein product [Cladocopium goreaui]